MIASILQITSDDRYFSESVIADAIATCKQTCKMQARKTSAILHGFFEVQTSNMSPLQIPKPLPSELMTAITVGQGGEVCYGWDNIKVGDEWAGG